MPNIPEASGLIELGPGRALLLDDPEGLWIVRTGRLDLFATPLDQSGEPVESGRFLFSLGPGQAGLGIASIDYPGGGVIAVRATAPTGTEILRRRRCEAALPQDGNEPQGEDESIVRWVDGWVAAMAVGLSGSDVRTDLLIEEGSEYAVGAGTRIGAARGSVLWVEILAGSLSYLGRATGAVPGELPLALFDRCWAVAADAAKVRGRSTETLAAEDADRRQLWAAVDHAGALFLTLVKDELVARGAAEEARIARKLRVGAAMYAGTLGQIAAILRPQAAQPEASADPLFDAAQMVAARMHIALKPVVGGIRGEGVERLDALCRAARINFRKVALAAEWYRKDSGPLLGFRAGPDESAEPIALLPLGGGDGYEIVDPTGGRTRVDSKQAAALLPTAYMFYRSLPDAPSSVLRVMRFGIAGMRSDMLRVLEMGLLGGLLSLVMPMISEPLFSDILPRADLTTLGAVITAMAVAAFGAAGFEIVRGFSLLRLQGRMEATLQAAIWDRLLRLPTGFFREYTTGDLADRAMSVTSIRSVLTATVNSAILDGLFSITSFCLLFYYSWRLALVATALALVAVIVTVALSALQIPHQRALMRLMGRVGGMTYQMLVAIAKLRVAGSEARAFARWGGSVAEQQSHVYSARRFAAVQNVVAQSFPPIASLAIYAAMIKLGTPSGEGLSEPLLTVGAYMAFSAAFGQFLAALMSVVSALTTAVTIVPLYERIGPILKAVPEVRERAEPPGELTGQIEFRRISFRYLKDTPPVLDDVSWEIRPGQYAAFVGPSGSGKSTILRLLLGFEQPESGSVFFDHKDLATLDLGELRRQIGVVMQSAGLISGSIFENIVGSLPLTMDDAWEAARMAGFDQDVRAMPMGMQTVLSESATSLSGGQRQRLIIARALVRKPRILIFDEATSALDNRTQAIVNDSLDQLNMTRIVVAHRLSTIRGVDRIHVLDAGRIIESGGYQELVERGGLFTQLVRRQVV
ncbi:MAG TPA: NHLP bacteriocin export ABC transporter permease/ATPase subunit [Stellaceae bacterium]|nr:NHLP bacteriocin export ABC transporter permease/ATPase subunit [Stellaceae bacterium]